MMPSDPADCVSLFKTMAGPTEKPGEQHPTPPRPGQLSHVPLWGIATVVLLEATGGSA